jgi:hypothetical protein
VTFITACAVVVEVEAKVWTLVYCDLVVTVEMTLIAMPPYPQLF